MKIEEVDESLESELERIKIPENSPIEMLEEYEKVKILKKKLGQAACWKPVVIIHSHIEKIAPKSTALFKNFSHMVENKLILPWEQACRELDLDPDTFKKRVKTPEGIMYYLNYLRERAELKAEKALESAADLNSPERIGELGQRIPEHFKAVRDTTATPRATLQRLLDDEEDIQTIVLKLRDLAMIYQAMADAQFYILSGLSDLIVSGIEELEGLNAKIAAAKKELGAQQIPAAPQKIEEVPTNDEIDEVGQLLPLEKKPELPPKPGTEHIPKITDKGGYAWHKAHNTPTYQQYKKYAKESSARARAAAKREREKNKKRK